MYQSQTSSFSDAELRDGFAVQFLPGKGRHLVATRVFRPGAVVLQQGPYVSVLSDEQTPGFCDFCFHPCERPLRCSRSKLARYCCKEHQRLAWVAGYKTECEALVRCAPRVPPPTVRLAARLLWRGARCLDKQQPQQTLEQRQLQQGPAAYLHVHHQPPLDSDHKGLWRLEHHWDKLHDRQKQLYAQMAVVTWQYMYGTPDGLYPRQDRDGVGNAVATGADAAAGSGAAQQGAWPGFRAVAQLLSMLSCNCHTVCDEELRPLGVALYPTGALVNHSCSPSTVQTFHGSTLQLRALRQLAPGDEITIAYIELAATRQERRETLADSYFFDINADADGGLLAAAALPPLVRPPEAAEGTANDQLMKVDCGITAAAAQGAICSTSGSSRNSGASCGGGEGPSSIPSVVRPLPLLTLDVAPNAQLHVYFGPPSDQPPWPTDPRDGELTRVDMPCGNIEVDHSSSARPLPGGLLARLVPQRPNEPEEEEQQGGEEEQDQRQEDDVDMGKGGYGAGPSSCAPKGQRGDVGPGAAGPVNDGLVSVPQYALEDIQLDGDSEVENSDAATSGGTGQRRPRLLLPNAPGPTVPASRGPHIELLAWGPLLADLVRATEAHGGGLDAEAAGSGPAVSTRVQDKVETATGPKLDASSGNKGVSGSCAGGPLHVPGAEPAVPLPGAALQAVVMGLVRRCVTALQLSHQADMALRSGEAGEAVSLLQQALGLLGERHKPGAHQQHHIRHPRVVMQHVRGSEKSLSLAANHILRLRLRAQLLKAAVAWGSTGGGTGDIDLTASPGASTAGHPWRLSLQTARALEPQYELCYPHPAWPNLSLHYAMLAKLEMLLGQPRRALKAASRALEGLRLIHGCRLGGGGEGGGVMGQMARTVREAEVELQMQSQRGAHRGGRGGEDELDEDDEVLVVLAD